jgi:hypothetical protein
VRLTLHDGEILVIADEEVMRVCESLWRLASVPDAIALGALVIAESVHPSVHIPLMLTAPQSATLRKAISTAEAA